MGKADYLKLGEWNSICDRCGFKRKSSDLKKTWDNLRVCADTCWEPRHPSDFFRLPEDNPSIPWARPEGTDSAGTTIDGETSDYLGGVQAVGDTAKTLTVGTDPTTHDWSTALTANRDITLDLTGAQQGDRFKIYRTAADGTYELDTTTNLFPQPTLDFVAEVEYNGVAWILISFTPLGI